MHDLVVVMAIAAGVVFAGQLRRRDSARGYLAVLASILMLTLAAALQRDPVWSVIAVSLVVLVVLVPIGLDILVRFYFARERLVMAVRFARWRAMLMLGAGLGRQQAILHGLAVLERDGVDDALSYFRALAHDAQDDLELRVIHEQIVSMLLFGQRWNEGIAHYEARFPPRYAAQRPPLALGLLRAYGESGNLTDAAGLLSAVEESLGRDPRANGVISQARLTFLAYAGASEPVTSALADEHLERLGLSAASGALYRGIALSRSGRSEEAKIELGRVKELAGAREEPVVRASQKAMGELSEPSIALGPELRSYAARVAEHLERFLQAAPLIRRSGMLWVTPGLLVLLGLGYFVAEWINGGGAGLLRLGAATPPLVKAGSWGRLITGLLVQTDGVGLLLSLYGVWLAGPPVERVYGRARTVLVSVGAGAGGLWAASMLSPDPTAVFAGAPLLTTGLLTAALTLLVSPRNKLPRRTRALLCVPLVLLILAMAVMVPRGAEGLDVSGIGMLVAALIGGVGAGLVSPQGRGASLLRGLAGLVLVAGPVAVAMVALEDPEAFSLAHRREVITRRGVAIEVPERFAVVSEPDDRASPWPLYPGLHDRLAQRVGDQVQIVVLPSVSDGPSALLRIDPLLARELVDRPAEPPPAWREAYEAVAGSSAVAALRTTRVRRDGRDLGIVIERPLADAEAQGVSVVLIAAPPEALERDPLLYATVLAQARPEPQ